MKKFLVLGAAFLASACGGDDVTSSPPIDASSPHEGGTPDATVLDDASLSDASSPTDAGADTDALPPAQPRLLLSMNPASTTGSSELVAINIGTHAVDGRVTYPGNLGTTYARGGTDPWLLQQKRDVVAKLDTRVPWKITSSWSVALSDRPDGSASYANPYAVVVSAASKGYVLRYTRNVLAVIDTTQVADGGAPASTIDLSPFVQANDSDGVVEMTAAFYVPARHLLYVLLGNIDRNKVSTDGYTILCADTKETVVGIDVLTNQIASLGGTGLMGSLTLAGYNPVGAAYDPVLDRILVVHAGCNTPDADGGAGPVVKRNVEEIGLVTKTAHTLFDANALGFPGSFAFIDATRAVIGWGPSVYSWDPTMSSLGPVIPNAPDAYSFTYDGTGNILGTKTNYPPDGGTSTDIVSVRISDGQLTKLATDPFTDNTGFIGGVEIWPRP